MLLLAATAFTACKSRSNTSQTDSTTSVSGSPDSTNGGTANTAGNGQDSTHRDTTTKDTAKKP